MPIAKFQMPDGRIARFEVPDGTTPEQAQAQIQSMVSGGLDQATEVPRETPEQPTEGMLDSLRQAILAAPGGSELAEFGAAVNRGTANLVDFFTTKPARAIQQLAGTPEQERIPTVETALEGATTGNFVEPGLTKDVLRASGELVAPGAAGGAALRAAGQAVPAIQAGAQTLGQGITRQLGSAKPIQDVTGALLSGTGGEVGEEVGGQPGKLVGAIAAPLAPQVLKSAAGNAVKAIFRGSDKNIAGINKTIDDFAVVGDTPTVGQATGRRAAQVAENLGSKVAGGAPVIRKAENLAANIQKRIGALADDVSKVRGAEEAGAVVKRGITGKGGFLDRFSSKSSDLWNKSDKFIPAESNVSIANTKATLDKLVRGGDVGKILDNAQLVKLNKALADTDNVPYQVLRDLRSSIGQKISNNELISDIPRAELKRMYGALSEDIRAVAASQGDEAIKAFNRANNFTRTGHNRISDFVGNITKKVEVNKIFDAITKGGEGTRLINSFKRSLKPNEWEIVSSNVIRRLGRTQGGEVFSVDKFVTDYNKLGKAKEALLSGTKKINAYRKDLDKIVRVAETAKESAKAAANASGSGQSAANFALATTAVSSAVTGNLPLAAAVGSTVAMNQAGARLMTHPGFVKWLATNSAHVGKITGAQLSSLVNIAKNSNLDDAMAIQSLVEELEEE